MAVKEAAIKASVDTGNLIENLNEVTDKIKEVNKQLKEINNTDLKVKISRQNEKKTYYLCDGNVPECRKHTCYLKTDDQQTACRYTTDISHAINFKKDRHSYREKTIK